jgi:prepilin-type N-terminal cleavage/methylation domain-containing protein/prepilin-type processing-associated H-X9-DG protein
MLPTHRPERSYSQVRPVPAARAAFTLVELLVVISIIGLLVALLLPAVQSAREAAKRSNCQNNLKQIVLAFHSFESSKQHLPFGKYIEGTPTPENSHARSWVPDILPYLEQANLVRDVNYDLDEDWWRMTVNTVPDPDNPGGYLPDGAQVPNGITVQKFLDVMICPSTAIPRRTQFKSDPAVGHKIGACGDYFAPEGVHSAILREFPATLPIGSAVPGFPAGTTATSNIVLAGVLHPFGTGAVPAWATTIDGDPRVIIAQGTLQHPRLAAVTDGTSNTIMIGECAGREDVWRDRTMTPANADRSAANCARARGGAWATNDNTYAIGQRIDWCNSMGTIPGKMKINNSNEWGHLYYAFHPDGANFGFADASVRFIADDVALWVLASLTTRAGGEATSSGDY